MNKHEVTLWTDEMVYVRGAIESQFERYCKQWRKTFIEYGEDGRSIAQVYMPGIEALRSAMKTFDKVLPPK